MDMGFGDRIRSERTRLGLSQAELARRIRVTRASVSVWEHGDVKALKHDNIKALTKLFGVSDDWLMHGKGSRGEPTAELQLIHDNSDPYTPSLNQDGVAWALRFIEDNIAKDVKKVRDDKWLARIFTLLYDAYQDDHTVATLDSHLIGRLIQL